MKKRIFLGSSIAILIIELLSLLLLFTTSPDTAQNAAEVNEVQKSVQADWQNLDSHINETELNYVVLDLDENVLFRTKAGLSENIHSAILHRDTILDIQMENLRAENVNGQSATVGKLIIYNNQADILQASKQRTAIIFLVCILLQCCIYAGYVFYVQRVIITPFGKLKGFAERIADGNLDIPLEMDRHNIFGAFTESFDIMRAELKKARIAEAKAKADKKELAAKLSHDIKTPVASIKALSEVGFVLAETQKQKETYKSIIGKADQINTLVTNLFTATLEELKQLTVTPSDMDCRELKSMLESSDYFRRANIPDFPECLVYADKLRLQQVFDNLFANSYKYAGTSINVATQKDSQFLSIYMEDFGGGVKTEELPLLKEKFRRGSNAGQIEGAGLGLYISDYFMKEMKGALDIENGQDGLRLTVSVLLSGTV